MYLNIYDLELNRVGSLQTWVSMTWEEEYNDEGSLTLEVVHTPETLSLLQPWRYCSIDESDQVMVILSIQIQDNHIVAYGKSAISVLDRRISTSTVSNTNAEQAMRTLVSNMSSWTGIAVGDSMGLTDTYNSQTSGGTILDYFKKIAESTDIGFKVLKKGYKGFITDSTDNILVGSNGDPLHVFTTDNVFNVICYKPPTNTNAKYSINYGNISDVRYSVSDVSHYNVALVAGQGEGENRVYVYAGNTTASGTNRLEMYVDARDLQQDDGESLENYKKRLVARGEEKLLEQTHIDTITFDISDNKASLGDVVSILLPEYGITKNVRITSRTITSEYNNVSIKYGVGNAIK